MLRQFRNVYQRRCFLPIIGASRSFLTNDYKCEETWNSLNSSALVNKINLNDFYNQLEQMHSSKGVISAIDVDLFAHAVNDSGHLEELKELLHMLRRSAETGNMLESTPHATIRLFVKFGYIPELIEILKSPLNFGVFLDDYTANILLDELLTAEKYEMAARVASFVMLQEDFSNELTCAFSQYAAYKHIQTYSPPETEIVPEPEPAKQKVEEIKIRIKFLRNPYHDDHFDITNEMFLSGKTLAWISETKSDNLNNNLQIIGWLVYEKYEKLLALCENVAQLTSFKIFPEVLQLINKDITSEVGKDTLAKCNTILSNVQKYTDTTLEESLKIAIENAINKVQKRDIESQQKLFKSWQEIRELKLEEQTKRLDRAKRMQFIQEKQKELTQEEQKLWFFDNEDKIDLQIEEKEKLTVKPSAKKKNTKLTDDSYIPPEILPKRK